jgi:hypothetical protein
MVGPERKRQAVLHVQHVMEVLAQRHKAAVLEHSRQYVSILRELRAAGFNQVREVRNELNRRPVPSPGGGRCHLPNARRTLERIETLLVVARHP